MPSEVRHILFKPAEAAEAVLGFLRARKAAIPRGSVLSYGLAEVPPGAPPLFRIVISPDRASDAIADGRVDVTCGGGDLAAALMMYCRERKVPLPMKATKTLERYGARVGLVLTLGEEAEAERQRA